MKKVYLLFPILIGVFIISSCEEEPQPEDCLGIEGGNAYVDSCGVCDDNISNDCVLDCSGEWGGNNICGCMDNTATNFNPEATFDDGSCTPDEIPPSISITSPTINSEVLGITSISFTASDNVGIDKIELYSSEGSIATVNGTDDVIYSRNWNTDLIDNGETNIYAIAYDLSGNVTTSDLVIVTIANTITITFNNQCFLPLACGLDNSSQPEFTIDAESNYSIEKLKNSGSFLFQGIITTTSDNSYNYVCSEVLGWEFEVEVGNQNITKNLIVGGSKYFINLKNSSVFTINDFYANYNLSSELGCSIDMPNVDISYPIGYFSYSSSSNARVYVDGESGYWLWENFGLDGSDNQYVNLNFSASGLNIVGQGGNTILENTIIHTHTLERNDFSLFND